MLLLSNIKEEPGKRFDWQVFDDDLGKDDLLGRALMDTRLIVKERWVG